MDERVNSIKEIISSTLVDIFVNKIYGSITKGRDQELLYHNEISKFNKNISSDKKSYMQVLNSIHVKFCSNTKHSSISLDGFVSIISEMLFPPEYFIKATVDQKYECLSHLLTGTIADMSQYNLKPEHITKVFNRDVAYCNLLKTTTNGIIHARIINIKNKFLGSENKPLVSDLPKYEQNIAQLNRQLAEEREKNRRLTETIHSNEKEIDSLTEQIVQFRNNETKFRQMIKLLKSSNVDKEPAREVEPDFANSYKESIKTARESMLSMAPMLPAREVVRDSAREPAKEVVRDSAREVKDSAIPLKDSARDSITVKDSARDSREPITVKSTKDEPPLQEIIVSTTNELSDEFSDGSIFDD